MYPFNFCIDVGIGEYQHGMSREIKGRGTTDLDLPPDRVACKWRAPVACWKSIVCVIVYKDELDKMYITSLYGSCILTRFQVTNRKVSCRTVDHL